MDVGEILSYKPTTGLKHGLDDENYENPKKKVVKLRTSDANTINRKKSRLTGMGRPTEKLPPPSPRSLIPPTPPRNVPPPTPMRVSAHRQKMNAAKIAEANEVALGPAPVPQRMEVAEQPQDEMEALLTSNEKENDGPLDESKIKQIVLNFEKKMLKNQEFRIKFPDDPRKFLESEVELNDAIEELHALSVVPQLYDMLLPLNLPHNLLSLVGHENTDIAAAVLDLMQEMTVLDGVDVTDEEQEGLECLVDSLLDEEVVSTLVHNLTRVEEAASTNPLVTSSGLELQAVHNTLAIIENLIDCRESVKDVAGPSGLLVWLLKKLKAKVVFEPNKLYASEILAICVQVSDTNTKLLGESDGIDVLLQQLAVYKRHDPSNPEEQELMENLFNILCSCLLLADNRERFLKGEGLQLMNLMLREKKLSRNGALKVLDHAVTGPEGTDCCNKFVDILGLRTIFPLFMKTPNKHGKKGLSKQEHEGHVVSIIQWMLTNCRSNQRQRLLNKFLENDHEKVDRLMELHFYYLDKVMTIDRQIEVTQQEQSLSEEEVYMRRLDGGLFTLQIIDFIMLCVCANGPPAIKRRVVKILNLRNASVKTIKNIIREYVSNLGEGSLSDEEMTEDQHKVLDWLDKFQNM